MGSRRSCLEGDSTKQVGASEREMSPEVQKAVKRVLRRNGAPGWRPPTFGESRPSENRNGEEKKKRIPADGEGKGHERGDVPRFRDDGWALLPELVAIEFFFPEQRERGAGGGGSAEGGVFLLGTFARCFLVTFDNIAFFGLFLPYDLSLPVGKACKKP